jgi:hypothetical protein
MSQVLEVVGDHKEPLENAAVLEVMKHIPVADLYWSAYRPGGPQAADTQASANRIETARALALYELDRRKNEEHKAFWRSMTITSGAIGAGAALLGGIIGALL